MKKMHSRDIRNNFNCFYCGVYDCALLLLVLVLFMHNYRLFTVFANNMLAGEPTHSASKVLHAQLQCISFIAKVKGQLIV